MMFNYHAESNTFTILRAMHRYLRFGPEGGLSFSSSGRLVQQGLTICLVRWTASIPDWTPTRSGCRPTTALWRWGLCCWPGTRPSRRCPAVRRCSPSRLNARVCVATVLSAWLIKCVQGCGRNMSLFLVMKKYDLSLADYLEKYRDLITPSTSLILLTQLLEGIQCALYICCPLPSTAQVQYSEEDEHHWFA